MCGHGQVIYYYLGHTVGIPEDDPNLGGSETLLSQLEDLVLDLVAGHLHPLGDGAPVGQGGLGNTLAWCVHAAHFSAVLTSETSRDERGDGKMFRKSALFLTDTSN